MHPNLLSNVGTQGSVWVLVGVYCLFAIIIFWVARWLARKQGVSLREIWWVTPIIVLLGCLFVLWILFGAYGAGTETSVTPPEAEGVYQRMEQAPAQLSLKELEELRKDERDPILKEIDNIASSKVDIDAELLEAVKQAIKIKK